MKDLNTKKRKEMIKEMSKKAQDSIATYIPESGVTIVTTVRKPEYFAKGNFGSCINPSRKLVVQHSQKELNFIQAFLILIGTITLFIFVLTMLEIRQESKLITCELRGDCSEVIRDINK